MTKQETEQPAATRPPRRAGRIIGRVLAIAGIILLIGVAAFIVWATWVPSPMPEAVAALESDAAVTVSGQNPIVFAPADSEPACGLIFYAGGRVDERAYAPALRAVAEEGILVLLPSMPLNLAVFSPNRAAGLIAQYPAIEHWVIAGHSLGGAMAAAYADSHPAGQPGGVHGLSLWAAYPAGSNDLSTRTDLAIGSIYASNDGLALISEIDESRARLPQSTIFTRIEGGNHAGFGWYGPQSGDGEATITRAEQQQQTVAATLATIRTACSMQQSSQHTTQETGTISVMRRTLNILLWIFAILLLVLIAGPFLVPVPPLQGLSPVRSLAEADSQFISVPLGASNTLDLHVKEAGDGNPALVLLHGFGISTFTWREVQDELAQRYRFVAFDRPAFGLTERPMRSQWGTRADWNTNNPYSAESQVELTINLMDQLGIERAVLVGSSAGGSIATLTALAHPQRVQALILLDPAIYSGGGSPAWIRPFLQTPQASRLGPLLARRIQDWGVDFATSAWHDPSRIDEGFWVGYKRPLQAENWDIALFELIRASRPLNLEQRLQELTLPILVITGDDDRIVPTADSIRLAGELPNAELVVIPNCGHVPHEECPAETLAAMHNFLARVTKGAN